MACDGVCAQWAMASDANRKLCGAAECGSIAAIERLIAAGANPDALVNDRTPLQWAARNSHVAAIAALLKAGARVDGASRYGSTPLVFAAVNGHAAAIDVLLAAGADVHCPNKMCNTALHWASMEGRLDAARALLDAGARTDVRNKNGKRPIDLVRAAQVCSVRLRDCATSPRR
jgi:ankyrin repeat protein